MAGSDGTLGELEEALASADSFESAGKVTNAHLARNLGAATINLFPLFSGANPEKELVVYSCEICVDSFRRSVFQALPVADRDFGTVSSQFSGSSRVIDANLQLGWEKLSRTETYNEWWRPFRVERQLLALLGTPDKPLGFLCVCRKHSDREFSPPDLTRLERVRRVLETKVERIAAKRDGWLGIDAVLLAMQAALPSPCGIFDDRGCAIWLNAAAEQSLGVRSTKVGGLLLAAGYHSALASWRDAVLSAQQKPASPSSLSGRQIVVRQVKRNGAAPIYFVTTPDGFHSAAIGLSRREMEIADMAGRGYSVLNVSGQLGLAEGTVRNHLKKIYRKLGVNNRAQLAAVVLTATAVHK